MLDLGRVQCAEMEIFVVIRLPNALPPHPERPQDHGDGGVVGAIVGEFVASSAAWATSS